MSIGEKLRKMRLEKSMTQQGMADALNINRTTYAKYESGDIEINASMAVALCNFFGASPNYLLETDMDVDSSYYSDPEIDDMVNAVHKDPDLKILFSASKKLKKEDLQTVINLVKALKKDDE